MNWTISEYNFSTRIQVFESTEAGKKCDLVIGFEGAALGDNITVDYYENSSSQPTNSKEIIVAELKRNEFFYPYLDDTNILDSGNGADTIFTGEYYPMSVQVPGSSKLTVTMKGGTWDYTFPVNWIISSYNDDNNSQIFESMPGPCQSDLTISFSQPGDIELLLKEESNGVIKDYYRYLYVTNSNSE